MKLKKIISAAVGVTMLCASLPLSSTTVDFVKDNVLTAKAVPSDVISNFSKGELQVDGKGEMGASSSTLTYEYASSVTMVTIGNNLTSIGAYAFKDFIGLKSIVIPKNITKIDEHAFDGCTSLESIEIPSSVKEIGEDAFKGTKWLANRRKESNNVVVINGILADGKACSGDVVVPNTVKKISPYAFRGNQNIKNVTLPNSIVEIETTPFYGCNKLQNIYYTGTQQEWESIKIDYRRQIMNATHKFDAKYSHSGDKDGIVIEAGKVIADISEAGNVRVPISVSNNTGFTTSELVFTFDDGVYAVDVESGLLTPSSNISPYGSDTVTVKTNSGTNKNGVIYYLDVELPYDAVVGSTYNIYMENLGFTTSSDVDPKISLKNPDKPDADKKIKAITITVTDKAKSVVTMWQVQKPDEPTTEPTTSTSEAETKVAIEEPTTENKSLGDVNGDGVINSKDSVIVLKAYAETLAGAVGVLKQEEAFRADVNGDGNYNSKDAVIILKKYAERLISDGSNNISDNLAKTSITMESVVNYENNTVDIPVKISGNVGFAGGGIVFNYDPKYDSKLSFDGVKNGIVGNLVTYVDNNSVAVTFASVKNIAGDGVMFTLQFKLPDDATQGGAFEIEGSIDTFCDSEAEDVCVKCVGGLVFGFNHIKTTTKPTTNTTTTTNTTKSLGDINGDEKIDSKDAVLVLKSYAESLVNSNATVDLAGDINGDKKVDSKDAVIILKYYAATLTGFTGSISEFNK